MVLLPRQIYLSPMDFYGTYGPNGGKLHHLKKMSGAATGKKYEIPASLFPRRDSEACKAVGLKLHKVASSDGSLIYAKLHNVVFT